MSASFHVDDDGFVRAPTPLVYRRLTDIGSWSRWWTGVRVTRLDTPDEQWAIEMARSRWRGLRATIRPHTYRHDHGFTLTFGGEVSGDAEFWLEPTHRGTVVHHLAGLSTDLGLLRTMTTYRTVLRSGLWGLKDDLHVEVRSAIGLQP